MVNEHARACGDIRVSTTAHLKSARDRIRDLQCLERTLSIIADKCSGDAMPECPIIDAMLGEQICSGAAASASDRGGS